MLRIRSLLGSLDLRRASLLQKVRLWNECATDIYIFRGFFSLIFPFYLRVQVLFKVESGPISELAAAIHAIVRIDTTSERSANHQMLMMWTNHLRLIGKRGEALSSREAGCAKARLRSQSAASGISTNLQRVVVRRRVDNHLDSLRDQLAGLPELLDQIAKDVRQEPAFFQAPK